MKILENLGELCDFIDPDLLLDEVVTLENSKNNITSNESFLSLTTSAECWKYIVHIYKMKSIKTILSRIMIVPSTSAFIETINGLMTEQIALSNLLVQS